MSEQNSVTMLQEFYKNYLISIIQKKNAEAKVESIQDILTNMDYLASKKDISKPGENDYYLPLSMKRILAFVLFGDTYRVETSKILSKINGVSCTAECSIMKRLADNTEVVVATNTSTVFYYKVEPAAEAEVRNLLMEQYAIGSAESLAWYRCGIGLQYAYDLEFLGDNSTPSPDNDGSDPDSKNAIKSISESETSALDSILKEAEQALTASTGNSTTSTVDPSSLPVLFGSCANQKMTLGEVAKKSPKYIPWMLSEIRANKVISLDGKQVTITPEYIKVLETLVKADAKMSEIYQKLYAA